jgi:precorrin-6A/cobalt-precorrin-6A reductase
VVTKNSGGVMTQPKLQAAHDLGIDVVMIRRPALPTGVRTVGTVDDAEAWVLSRDSGAG